jgi:hypothetical protein
MSTAARLAALERWHQPAGFDVSGVQHGDQPPVYTLCPRWPGDPDGGRVLTAVEFEQFAREHEVTVTHTIELRPRPPVRPYGDFDPTLNAGGAP